MGESTHLWNYSIENDLALLPWISSLNIACGFHAGDPHTMHELVAAALEAGIAIGAHPSFDDRAHFGRQNMSLSPEKIYDLVVYQVGALQSFLQVHGAALHHVKPHGALYNMAAADTVMATAVCKAIKDIDAGLVLYGLSGSELIKAADAVGLSYAGEVFADRTYQPDGSLTPRSQPDALITDEAISIQQVLQMVRAGTVHAATGAVIPIAAQTICIHSDGAHALDFARTIHHALKQEGIEIKAA